MSTRAIVDGTAVEILKSLSYCIRTYFTKIRHTIVDISPDGLITLLSDVFNGKDSDKHVFEICEI